jgi:hypothetical protein
VTLIFPDGAIVNRWLEVRVLADEVTGLAEPSVVHWGSLVGEAGAGDSFAVTSADLAAAAEHSTDFRHPAGAENPYDMNRDGIVDGTDFIIVRDRLSSRLVPSAPAMPPAEEASTLAASRGVPTAEAPNATDRAFADLDRLFDLPW